MIVGVLSDTHGRLPAIAAALAEFCRRKAELIIHCGDIDSAETVGEFQGWNVHFVLGNCDWDREGIRAAIAEIGGSLHEPFGHLELDRVQIAWAHGHQPDVLGDLERADHYDFLFYGHTHVAEQHRAGKTVVVNPGALQRTRTKSCLTLDTAKRKLSTIVLDV